MMNLKGLASAVKKAKECLEREDLVRATNHLNVFLTNYEAEPGVPYFEAIETDEITNLLSKKLEDLEPFILKYKIKYSKKVLSELVEQKIQFYRTTMACNVVQETNDVTCDVTKMEIQFYLELLKNNLEEAKTKLNHITNHYILLAMTNTDAVSLSKDGDIIEVPDQVEKNYEGLSIILQYFKKHGFDF